MDKVTLDFKNNIVEWDTDHQKGTEICPDLGIRKPLILAAMGYGNHDISEVINIVNAFANGEMSIEEVEKKLSEQKDEN